MKEVETNSSPFNHLIYIYKYFFLGGRLGSYPPLPPDPNMDVAANHTHKTVFPPTNNNCS